MTSASIGLIPIVRIASISSVSFIVPIWAANAEPERPATIIAVINTPNSRRVIRPTRLTVRDSAPNCCNCAAPCCAITIPIRKLIKPTMGSALTPTSSSCRTKALARKRDGWRMIAPAATSICPRKPITPMMPKNSWRIKSPTCSGTRSHTGWRSGRISASLPAVSTAPRSLCACSLAPVISALWRAAAWQATQAPTVSI